MRTVNFTDVETDILSLLNNLDGCGYTYKGLISNTGHDLAACKTAVKSLRQHDLICHEPFVSEETGQPNGSGFFVTKKGRHLFSMHYNPRRAGKTTYLKAYNHVVKNQKCTIGDLSRTLDVSYNDAAKLVEQLQNNGVVSVPFQGVRAVLHG